MSVVALTYLIAVRVHDGGTDNHDLETWNGTEPNKVLTGLPEETHKPIKWSLARVKGQFSFASRPCRPKVRE